ncbi:hypothetical protein QQ045_021987 [Rhodiola kirilowii]
MPFDPNSVPTDLRPINLARVLPEEPPRIVQTTATERNIEGFVANSVQNVCTPNPTPVCYPVAFSEPRDFPGEESGNLNQGIPDWCQRLPVGMGVGCNPALKYNSSANLVNQGSNLEWKNDGLIFGKKIKFLCSFGGKILPRPGSGVLRYVGGHTRLIDFKGNINFNNVRKKMVETCGQPVTIKYQLPGEDLDALVSIACQEDFDIMMEEYDRVIKSLPDGSARLQLYLFPISDADSSGLVTFSGFYDNGQKYFEAINGILDEAGGLDTRIEGLNSAASVQNPDSGGTKALITQARLVRENTPRAVPGEPHSSDAADASAVHLGVPLVGSSAQISNSELEEKSVFPTISQQKCLETKQVAPTSTPYMRASVAQRQDIKGTSDSMQFPSQVGFLQPPTVGIPGSVFQQDQLLVNAVTATPKHFLPAMPMSGNPQSVMRPYAVQQMMHPSQVWQNSYPAGVAYPMGMFPLNPSYCTYPTQVAHSVVGGAYGWNTSTPNRTVFHEGLAPHQQLLHTTKLTKLDDCYMCQKALPHAHSDSLAQQLKDGIGSSTSDSNRSYHSLLSEVSVQNQPPTMVWTDGSSRQVFDEPSSRIQSKAPNQADNQATIPAPQLEVSQNLNTSHENEKTSLLMTENMDHSKLLVSQGMLVSGGFVPYSTPIHKMLQSHPDISVPQYAAPTQLQAIWNGLVNMATDSEVFPTAKPPSQTPEHLTHESSKEISDKSLGAVLKENILDFSTDSFGQPNQPAEAPSVCSPKNVNTELGKFDGPLKEELVDQKPIQNEGTDMYVDSIFKKAECVFDSNQIQPTETSPGSFQEVSNSTCQSTESYAVPLQPITGYAVERPSAISAWKDDASQFQFTESVTSNGHAPSCIMPYKVIENVIQDSSRLFNNQDPLITRQDITFPLAIHNPIAVENEPDVQDPFDGAFMKNGNELNTELRLDDDIRLSSTTMIIDSSFEREGPSEELTKQELQTVAEGLVDFNLHAAPPPPSTDLSPDGVNELLSDTKQDEQELNNDSQSQQSPKLEDVKAKIPDKANLGFPTSNLGRLQIINNKDLEELRELGSGTFGTVYHGKWRGTDVAIKRINDRCFQGKPSEEERMRDDFWNEAIKLADLHHPNVLAFYGVVLDGPGGSVATVTEYMVNGSLRNALKKNES